MKYTTFLATSVLLLPCVASAADSSTQSVMVETHALDSDSLESVVDAFIASYAKGNIAWKKDIVLTSTPREIPAGRQLGLSWRVGYYTFAPKTWCDLTEQQRDAVLHDPRFKAFLISLSRPATYPKDQVPSASNEKSKDFDASQSAFPMTGRPQQ